MKIGFIGQGFIGKNYADNFEERGLDIVRYSQEEPYIKNKEKIKKCDIVFIAVPTPSTPEGFDYSIVEEVLKLIGKGKVAVIKSTIKLGTTELLQKQNPDIFVVHSPEFLSEVTARHDSDNPDQNIVGIPIDNKEYQKIAKEILLILPKAPYDLICTSREAEMIKYSHNMSGFFQIIFFNMLYDFAKSHDCNWEVLREAYLADPLMSDTYLNPFHKKGRGAGGHCFIKDFATFKQMYKEVLPKDVSGNGILKNLEKKNKELLRESQKDLDLLEGVYGNEDKD